MYDYVGFALTERFCELTIEHTFVIKDNWTSFLSIQIYKYKCLGVMTGLILYKKVYLTIVVIRERCDREKKGVNTDNTSVPK